MNDLQHWLPLSYTMRNCSVTMLAIKRLSDITTSESQNTDTTVHTPLLNVQSKTTCMQYTTCCTVSGMLVNEVECM